jgi:hypothetical protein
MNTSINKQAEMEDIMNKDYNQLFNEEELRKKKAEADHAVAEAKRMEKEIQTEEAKREKLEAERRKADAEGKEKKNKGWFALTTALIAGSATVIVALIKKK